MRKYFRIIIILLVLGLILGLGYYWYSTKKIGGLGQNSGESIVDLFPFGGSKPADLNTPANNEEESPSKNDEIPTGTPALVNKKLTKIVSKPIAGYTYVLSLREKSLPTEGVVDIQKINTNIPENFEEVPAIRYVEQETGNIYDIMLDTLQIKRLSNITIPKLHEAIFSGENGEYVYLRYLEEDNRTINTYLGKVPVFTGGGDTESKLTGSFLERGIRDLVVSPDKTKVFYTVPFGDNISGVVMEKDGTKASQIFSSVFHGWLPEFSSKNTVLMTTKASAYASGFNYTLDTKTKKVKKLAGNIGGLVSKLSIDEKYLAYSNSIENSVILRLLNIKNNTSRDTGLKTIPEKCSFGGTRMYLYCGVPNFFPPGAYPDDWYKGKVLFSDNIFRIDPDGDVVNTLLVDLSGESGEQIDAVSLAIDTSESYLLFINRSDNSLWKYNLK